MTFSRLFDWFYILFLIPQLLRGLMHLWDSRRSFWATTVKKSGINRETDHQCSFFFLVCNLITYISLLKSGCLFSSVGRVCDDCWSKQLLRWRGHAHTFGAKSYCVHTGLGCLQSCLGVNNHFIIYGHKLCWLKNENRHLPHALLRDVDERGVPFFFLSSLSSCFECHRCSWICGRLKYTWPAMNEK